MAFGTPVSRHCVITLRTNDIVVDMGDNNYLNIHTGVFVKCKEDDISHTTSDLELEVLRLAKLVDSYDANKVYITALQDPPRGSLE